MDHRQIARTLAVLRVALGGALVVAPGVLGRAWLGPVARRREVKLLVRGFGARDLALGLGTFRALDRGEPAETWVALSAAADATDALGAVAGSRALGWWRAAATGLSAAGAAGAGAYASRRVD